MHKVTQKDIAQAAGVSQALVSMVLNGEVESSRVPAARRREILAIAAEMGYRPRKKRRVKGKDKLFVFVSSPLGTHPERSGWLNRSVQSFYAKLYEQVHLAALQRGYSTMHYPAERIEELTRWLSEWDVSGVFWNNGDTDLLNWVAPRFPVVQLERCLKRSVDSCVADQGMAVQLAMEHLYDRGHRRIGYISKKPEYDYLANARFFSLGLVSERLGMEVITFNSGTDVLEQMGSDRQATALIAPDLFCFAVIQQLSAAGYHCPEDLSIVGIDNFEACDFSNPALTSVDLNFKETANAGIELLLARINGASYEARSISLMPHLVVRNSVCSLFPEASGAVVQTPKKPQKLLNP